LVLDVVSNRATRAAEKTVVTVGSEVGITGEVSSSMVISFKVELFFDRFEGGFFVVLVIVGTFVLKGVAKSEEADK
jgi:hypothetical protein